jgi:uncharacterized protein
MQHPIFTEQLPATISPKLLDYLKSLPSPENRLIRIVFFGGEPLLYMGAIKTIVKELAPTNSFNFVVVTNGALLDEDMVDFFNYYHVGLGVSCDGNGTENFRSKNVLEDPRLVSLYNKLNSVGFSAVKHAKNDSVGDIIKYFLDKGIDADRVNIDLVMDTGLHDKSFVDFDFDKFEKEMKEIEDKIYHSLTTGEPCPEMSIANPLISRIRFILGKSDEEINNEALLNTKCGVGKRTLNVDLDGNCHLCHNSSIKIGTIDDSYEDLVNAFLPYDKYATSDKCSQCPAQVLCSGGCILVGDEARENYYCRMLQTFFGATLNALKRLNSFEAINKEEMNE